MAIFKVNTGTRKQEVCRPRWDWEIAVPELNTSVFVVPADFGGRRELSGVKNGEDRVIVMNQAARAVIETRRGIHPEFVFTWRRPSKKPDAHKRSGKPVKFMNNTAWQSARVRAARRLRGEVRAARALGVRARPGARSQAHVRPKASSGRRGTGRRARSSRPHERRRYDALQRRRARRAHRCREQDRPESCDAGDHVAEDCGMSAGESPAKSRRKELKPLGSGSKLLNFGAPGRI
jgi:hypothetical protein